MQPDLIVFAPDTPDVALVAEVTREVRDRPAIEAALKEYMLDNRCGFALLVTPFTTWIYRDTLRDYSEASIREVGAFDTADLLGLERSPAMENDLFHAVREWLERLASAWMSALPVALEARKLIAEYLVPAVIQGRVFPGHASAAGARPGATAHSGGEEVPMKQKTWTETQGPIPGSGRWQETVSTRPDDPGLVSRPQMKELVGVSNTTVITKALERLSIAPAGVGSWNRKTYNNGGSGNRGAEVLYFERSSVQAVRDELKRRATPTGDGRFSYKDIKFRWTRAD